MDASQDSTFTRYRLRLEPGELPDLEGLEERYHNASETVPLLHSILEAEPFETVGALFLDHRFRPAGYSILYRGTLVRSLFEPRAVLVAALLAHASVVVLFHNHPSGNPHPSLADIEATRKLEEAAKPLQIEVWDHIVLGEAPRYQSVRRWIRGEAGMIPPLRPRAKPKYRHPETGETWAGRGSMARWLREALEAGASLEDFRVD
ncbi:MAG: JAB domain-containing protein [Acidobacteriota bacterium]|nr:JAB domain-containing protein [Acidobacteriota bacterium]